MILKIVLVITLIIIYVGVRLKKTGQLDIFLEPNLTEFKLDTTSPEAMFTLLYHYHQKADKKVRVMVLKEKTSDGCLVVKALGNEHVSENLLVLVDDSNYAVMLDDVNEFIKMQQNGAQVTRSNGYAIFIPAPQINIQ